MKNNTNTYINKHLQGTQVEWKTLRDCLIRIKATNITAGQMKEMHKEEVSLKIFAEEKTSLSTSRFENTHSSR